MNGVQRVRKMSSIAEKRQEESITWPFRIMRGFRRLMLDIENLISYGIANLPGRRSSLPAQSYQEPLYRPHKNQLSNPYHRKDQIKGWKKKPNPAVRYKDRNYSSNDINTSQEREDKINVSNYWKIFPNFSTSSANQSRRRTFHWREDPYRSNRRAGGKIQQRPKPKNQIRTVSYFLRHGAQSTPHIN